MKKKICFLTDSVFSFGGVQRVTAVIAKHLSKRFDVTIVTFDKPSDQDLSIYQLDEADIHYRYIRYPNIGKIKRLLCKLYSALYRKLLPQTSFTSNLYAHSSFPSELRRVLTDELKAGEYDTIIGVHAPLAVRLSAIRYSLPGVKLVGWIHNSVEALFGKESLYIGPELLKFYIYLFGKLNEVIVLSQDDAKKYRERYYLQTTVLYNPLTLSPGPKAQKGRRLFLAVGRLSYLHKGFDILIEAFHLFAKEDSDWSLCIVGEGPEKANLQEMISNYNLSNRITIHPFTKHIQEYYSRASVFVLSSRWEGLPLVLMEAMSHGLPIISSDLPTCNEIMGDFGIYFKNGNAADLALKLSEATKIDWEKQSEVALQIAQRFHVDNIIKAWEKIL